MVTIPPPMSAAERQRKCREGGKGRHRGGGTSNMIAAGKKLAREIMTAAAKQPAAEPPEVKDARACE